jgi:hypothetical protein
MKVKLYRIDQLPSGSSHLVFLTDINTHFTSKFSFTVPKEFSSKVCRFIEESTFTELDVSIIPSSRGKEMMEITSYVPYDPKSKTVFRLTEYTRDKSNE